MDAYGYGYPVPAGGHRDLIAAAAEHRAALVPASRDEIERCVRGLRSATLIRGEEHAAEAKATLALLIAHLSDVPADILQEACRAYCNAPGRRFFPRSAGELRTFINPLLRLRIGRAYRLERLAEQARAEQAERDRLAADPVTPEGIAAVMAEFGIGRLKGPATRQASSAGGDSRPPILEATVEQYIALGMSVEEAQRAVEDRRRMLARGAAKPIGATAPDLLTNITDRENHHG